VGWRVEVDREICSGAKLGLLKKTEVMEASLYHIVIIIATISSSFKD